MKLHSLIGLLGLGYLANAVDLRPRNYDSHDYYVLHLDPTANPIQVAGRLGLTHDGGGYCTYSLEGTEETEAVAGRCRYTR
ncbi:hypothetical protein EYC80_004008 [Monilinia laxa]|uniref:Uncharacterized protein n=1 Tax=Monilinia laxa TaxID=61186 RepID=A0A5N6KLK2_MONLA|nr:hypothetical protein EYC80_004008 [Monilinia laxa]